MNLPLVALAAGVSCAWPAPPALPPEAIEAAPARREWSRALALPLRLHAMVAAAIARVDLSPLKRAGEETAVSGAARPPRAARPSTQPPAWTPPAAAPAASGLAPEAARGRIAASRLGVSLSPAAPAAASPPRFRSYYAAVRRGLDEAWRGELRPKIEKALRRPRYLGAVRAGLRTVVLIDASGRVVGARVIDVLGARALDEAAIRAFNESGPYPKPPPELLDSEGRAAVRWDVGV